MGSGLVTSNDLFAGGVLGDGLGALRDGVLGKLSREDETNCGLDFARRDGRALVVVRKAGCFGGDALEDVVHERVHDRHGLGGDSGVGVDLLQDTVDVHGVRLLS